MLDQETTNLQFPTNSIYHKLKNILDFFIETGEYEDIIDLGKSYRLYITSDWNPDVYGPLRGIEVIDGIGNHIKIIIEDYDANKYVSIVLYQNRIKHRKSIELDFSGPEDVVLDMFTDKNIKKLLPEEFYNFLINLKENYVKVKMV